MIYLDTSALMKLIAPEPESAALSVAPGARGHPRITSALAGVEVLRAFREVGAAAEELASIVLSKIDQLSVGQDVLDAAAELRTNLTPLEAVHLASACALREGRVVYVSYGEALLVAAAQAGLATASPGASAHPASGPEVRSYPCP